MRSSQTYWESLSLLLCLDFPSACMLRLTDWTLVVAGRGIAASSHMAGATASRTEGQVGR